MPLSSARTAGQTLSLAELPIGGCRGHTIYGPAGLYEGTLAGAERPDAAGDGGRPAPVRDRASSASGALALNYAACGSSTGPRSYSAGHDWTPRLRRSARRTYASGVARMFSVPCGAVVFVRWSRYIATLALT